MTKPTSRKIKPVARSATHKKDSAKRAEISHLIASAYGANELCRQSKTFGERVYWRMARDQYVKIAKQLGHETVFEEIEGNLAVIHLPGGLYIEFKPRDIEQMRACVAKWDAEHP